MASLTGSSVATTYDQLLTLPSGGGNTTTLVALTDGDGVNTFCLQLATTKAMIEGNGSTLYFFDEGGESISADNAGVLSIAGGAEIDITAPTVDINASTAVTVDGSAITISKDTDAEFVASILVNQSDAADTTGIISQRFDLEDTGGNAVDSGKILVGKEASFTATGSTQDSYMALHTSLNGTLAEKMRIDSAGDVTFTGELNMADDKGIIFGAAPDYWLGYHVAEDALSLASGGTAGAGTNEGLMNFVVGDSTCYFIVKGGEGADARLMMYADQGDQQETKWYTSAETNNAYYWRNISNSPAAYMNDAGGLYLDSTVNEDVWDYAELFKWKTHLDSDDAVRDLFGMSVVLDGDAVRIAEEGEEDKILGVVRPKGSTGAHGDGLKWRSKFIRNVWGEYEEEGYTMVNWQEFLSNGNVSYRHAYPKDEIPEFRLKEGVCRDRGSHTKEENFELNKDGEKIPVVVPSTEEEKTAANYVERTTHKTTGETLTRRKYSDTYDSSIPYIRREDRPKEWVLIGLLGQVPVRTSAVIPDHWVKQKNLESGIDFYYIFNK